MLGFRSLYRTHDLPDLLDSVTSHVEAWLRHKRYDVQAALDEGPMREIASGVHASLQRHVGEAGQHTLRTRLVEHTRMGTWTSELTAHNSATGNRGWIWLDVQQADNHDWTATPRLARELVKALPVRDGAHQLTAHAHIARDADVDLVVAAVTDPNRHGLVFVAGTGLLTRTADWRDVVQELVADTVGLASTFVLTPTATDLFNHRMTRSHQVTPGSVRTYRPGVSVGDVQDAERHRFITAGRLEHSRGRALRRVLGQRAREQVIAARLPTTLRDLDRILRSDADGALLDALAPTPATAPAPRPAARPAPRTPTPHAMPPRRPAPPTPASPPVVPPATPSDAPQVVPEQLPAAEPTSLHPDTGLAATLQELVGATEITLDVVARLAELASSSQQAGDARARLASRLAELRDTVEESRFERDLAREELAAEQSERAAAEDERAEAERQVRRLRLELSSAGRPDAAWSDAPLDVVDIRPDTFADLIDRLDELPRIEFTGDRHITLELDRHSTGRSWASTAWDALLALDDYARTSTDVGFAGDVAGYLAQTPAGCRGFPARRHAFTESEEVQSNPRFRTPRELPVPPEFDESEIVFMGAHFKIARSSMVSPRLHYADGTARTGLIYVGYLGPHLPTSQS